MVKRTLQAIPTSAELQEALDPRVVQICERLRAAGGRPLLVGGAVRDWLLTGLPSKDLDLEIRSLDLETVSTVLSEFGELNSVGRSFGVLRISGIDADFSLPRRDSRVGRGHRGIRAEVDPDLSIVDAARRRDLTINSMAIDPIDGEFFDPLGGQDDLQRGVLRAADENHFGEDPLRALRVVQFAARLEMEPDAKLLWICHDQNLSELSAERVFEEFRKLLLRARRPSLGLRILQRTELLRHFPALHAIVGVPQDPEWHPEGDVWEHTLMVLDEAAGLRLLDHNTPGGDRASVEDDLALMFAALCHDLGKATTTFDDGQRVRSPAHDAVGEKITRSFLRKLRAPKAFTERVCVLVREHLAPALFEQQGATDKAYRRLSRRLDRRDVSMQLLERLARADHFGRTTPDALARSFPAGDLFLEKMSALTLVDGAPPDIVRGQLLRDRGVPEGPELGAMLKRCRAIQDETGWTDPEKILERALGA